MMVTTTWAEPDKLGFRRVGSKAIRGHPSFDVFDAWNHPNHQSGSIILSDMTIDLQVVSESVSPETLEFNDVDDLRGISYEQDRAEDRTLRDTGSDRHCPGSSAIEPDELSAADEKGLNPLDDSSRDAVVVFEPIEKDLVVDRVERRA